MTPDGPTTTDPTKWGDDPANLDRAVWAELHGWLEVAKDSDSLGERDRERLDKVIAFVEGVLRALR